MELVGKQAYFLQQQQNSSSLPGSFSCSLLSCGDFSPRWSSSKLLLLPRISDCIGVVSRFFSGKHSTVWKWVCQQQQRRVDRLRVEAKATISAGRGSITARRRSTSRRPEGSGGLNVDLELEIMAFMLQSGKSDVFPSKEELISAGRLDLVEAIVSEGGWLAAGWEKKANASFLGSGLPEIAHRPPSRQRALRNKTKAVRSSRQPRGRPKLVERRALSNDESTCENSEPSESREDATSGRPDDENLDSRRGENSIDDGGAAKLEAGDKEKECFPDEEPAFPFFEQVRKEQGSRFPSSSVEYLWEFGSLADFIKERKLDTKSGMMQRQQWGLSRKSSARRRRLDSEAAKRRRDVCDTRCISSDRAPVVKQGSKCDQGTNGKKGLDKASTTMQDSRVDQAVSPKSELHNAPTVEQDLKYGRTLVDQAVNLKAELGNTSTSKDDSTRISEAGLDEAFLERKQASTNAPKLDKPAAAEQDARAEDALSSNEQLAEASTGGQSLREPVADVESKIKKKKKRRKLKKEKPVEITTEPVESNGTLDWINQMVDQREKWMLEAKSSAEEGKPRSSVQDRIRSLEDRLSATRTALQSGREALEPKGDEQAQPNTPSDVHKKRLSELRDASDELEYTENKILRSYSELATTRAQVAALQGKHGLDIMDVRKAADEHEKKMEMATSGLQSLRAARIVWPNPAGEVFLIGSFDGWNQKIKMEISGAGVFVATVNLLPGRYEIKFIVDGTWRVDTARPIVYVGGYENNVLIIPESFRWRG